MHRVPPRIEDTISIQFIDTTITTLCSQDPWGGVGLLEFCLQCMDEAEDSQLPRAIFAILFSPFSGPHPCACHGGEGSVSRPGPPRSAGVGSINPHDPRTQPGDGKLKD